MARHGGGKGANAAVAAARVGAAVTLVGAVGADDMGRAALDELRAEGVAVDRVAVLDGVATGVALIVVDGAGENQIAVGAGANAQVDPDAVRAAVSAALPGAGCVLVSTEIPAAAVVAAVETAAAACLPCVLNPAPVLPELVDVLGSGPLLTPNAGELDTLATLAEPSDTDGKPDEGERGVRARDRACRLVAHTGAPVVVTLGGDGALVVGPDGTVHDLPPRPATVRDTTGAGDTFNGVLAAYLAGGADLVAAARAANVAAALSVAQPGARRGMPSAAALAEALRM
jgi:ribokinase